jgi:hypothetical protein
VGLNQGDPYWSSDCVVIECNLFTVGPQARQHREQRGVAELFLLATVRPASPEDAFGVGDVGHPRAVLGKRRIFSRDARKKGLEPTGLRFEALQFTAEGLAYHEKFLAIFAGKGHEQTERAGSQLDWLDRGLAKKLSPFWECPDLPLRSEDKVFSVRCPFPTAFC